MMCCDVCDVAGCVSGWASEIDRTRASVGVVEHNHLYGHGLGRSCRFHVAHRGVLEEETAISSSLAMTVVGRRSARGLASLLCLLSAGHALGHGCVPCHDRAVGPLLVAA